MIQLIFTSDYELFGNGQGEVERCMIDPSNLLMNILEDFGYRMTFFVDVCEIWAFERTKQENKFDIESDPARIIKDQMIQMIQRGHDVQLHLHPQWLDYSYEKQNWQLNYDYWRLPKLTEHPNWTIDRLIKSGKDYLEDLIKPIKSDYRCQAFRAGAYCIQPEEKVVRALKRNGFKYDSSVLTGMKLDNGLSYFDFTNMPNKASWKIGDKLENEVFESKLTELPIYTTPVSRTNYVKYVKKRTKMKACKCAGEPATKSMGISTSSKFQKALSLLKNQHLIFDYCGSSFDELKFIAKSSIKKYLKQETITPITLIGHPKNFDNEENLRKFLEWCNTQNAISKPISNNLYFQQ